MATSRHLTEEDFNVRSFPGFLAERTGVRASG